MLAVLVVILVLSRLLGNFAADDLRDRPHATGLAPGWQLLADEPERGALVAGSYEENLALDYLTQVWGARTDVKTLAVGKIDARTGQPIYASRAVMPIVSKTLPVPAKLSSHGLSLIAIRNTPLGDTPAGARKVSQPAVHGLQLAAYALRRQGQQQLVSLYWRAETPIDVDMAVSVRLMRGGDLIAQADSAHPVDGYYPMTRWTEGEVVRDDYALAITAGGAFDRIHVIAYHTTPAGFENLAEFDLAL
jgi:hypothetical protein